MFSPNSLPMWNPSAKITTASKPFLYDFTVTRGLERAPYRAFLHECCRYPSIDEISARLSPRDDAESVVDRVTRSVAVALSPLVPVSVGVASSAWLAKCAAEAHKPDAAVVWRRDDLPAVYAGLELEDLPGAGPRICARLRAAGLTTVEAIHAASRSRVIDAWGSIEGERVRLALQGEDVPARVSPRQTVSHGRVLTGRDRHWREARRIVRWLAVCALHRCAEGGAGAWARPRRGRDGGWCPARWGGGSRQLRLRVGAPSRGRCALGQRREDRSRRSARPHRRGA